MKMNTTLLESDPESPDHDPMQCQNNNEDPFFNRIQKKIKRHRFLIHTIKVILYLELILAIGVVGYISLSNYYSHQRYNNETSFNLPAPTSDNTGDNSSLNSDNAPGERIPWRTKEAVTTVSTELNHVSTDADINSKLLTVIGSVSSKINGDVLTSPRLQENFLSDLRNVDDSDTSSNEDDMSKYIFSDEREEDQIIQQLIQSLLSKKVILEDTFVDNDSSSWSDIMPALDLKTKRSADSSSSESSSSSSESSSSSSESESSEPSDKKKSVGKKRSSNKEEAAVKMLTEILTEMERQDCLSNSKEHVTSISDRAQYVKTLKETLATWILNTPIPDCAGSSPSLAVNKCGSLTYKCPRHGTENGQSVESDEA